MKKFLFSLSLLALLQVAAQAVTVVFTVPAGSAWNSTNFFMGPARVNTVSISTGSASGVTNLQYALTDSPTSAVALGWGPIKRTNTAYVQVSTYLTNLTKITTNFSGALITNVFTNALVSYTNTVGQTSNDWRRIAVGTVGSNSTVSLTGPFPVIFGLGLTNNNIGVAATVTVDYDPGL